MLLTILESSLIAFRVSRYALWFQCVGLNPCLVVSLNSDLLMAYLIHQLALFVLVHARGLLLLRRVGSYTIW